MRLLLSIVFFNFIMYDIEKDTLTHTWKGSFRKVYPNTAKHEPYRLREKQLIEHLQKHPPHPNVVTFHRVTDRYIDMDYLYPLTDQDTFDLILPVLTQVKTFLQSIGIIYMDWKRDNVAKGRNGYTLIDFDHSGLVDKEDLNVLDFHIPWIVEPSGWSYAQAKRVCGTPKEMDEWSFDYFARPYCK